jgi:hypothetical protein
MQTPPTHTRHASYKQKERDTHTHTHRAKERGGEAGVERERRGGRSERE